MRESPVRLRGSKIPDAAHARSCRRSCKVYREQAADKTKRAEANARRARLFLPPAAPASALAAPIQHNNSASPGSHTTLFPRPRPEVKNPCGGAEDSHIVA